MPKSDTPVALFFADSHLDHHNWSNRPTLCGDSVHSFSFLADKACELEVPMIGAGDLIDVRRPEPYVIGKLRDSLDNLQSCGIPFYYIQGQHELDRDNPWLQAVHPHTTHINKSTIELRGVKIYGLDWTAVDNLSAEIKAIPSDTDVFVCHQVWHEFMGDMAYEGHLADADVEHIFTGDFHENSEIFADPYSSGDSKSAFVISPGSTNMRKITEPAKKYYYVLYDNMFWESYLIPTRYVLRYEVYTALDLENVAADIEVQLSTVVRKHNEDNNLPPNLCKPIVHVKYSDDVVDTWSCLNSVCDGVAHIFYKVITAQVEEAMSEAQREVQALVSAGPTECLKVLLDEESELYKFGLALLQSENPADLLLDVREARGLLCD
jgi:hypothetical protein